MPHPGIRFPDRAEALDRFQGYRVFLDPWEPIADSLRSHWSGVALRGESGILGVYGPQGAGKTLLTRKLSGDFESTRAAPPPIVVDQNNFWHRVSGGAELDRQLVADGTNQTEFHSVENQTDWAVTAAEFARGAHRATARVLLADNAERAYFRQGLVEMTDVEYLQVADNPSLNRLAAQRLVDKLRTDLRGTLLVLLSNDDSFLLGLQEAVDEQHTGLMSLATLRPADPRTKETIIRVNTNRLNPASYWSAIDQASDADRIALKHALAGDDTFPDSFRAVDAASRNRIGRPARKNVLTFVALAATDDAASIPPASLGTVKRSEVSHEWISLTTYEEGWAPIVLGEREAGLLESEWMLRVCILGAPFVRSLLAAGAGDPSQQAQTRALLRELKTFHGPGAHASTRTQYTATLKTRIDTWVPSSHDAAPFWGAGQHRSTYYEPVLAALLPGYNTTASGFLTYRPDYVVTDFAPAAILDSLSDEPKAVRAAIQRSAHVFEFTATNSIDPTVLRSYLGTKLGNYVSVTQEQ